MELQTLRTIIFYKNYYLDFYNSLSNATRKKINQILVYLRDHYQIPNNAVKHITNSTGIYEIRCAEGSNEYRVLFFFEEGTLATGGKIVILCNGFLKKNKKDLNKPLELAEFLKAEYLSEKNMISAQSIDNISLSTNEITDDNETT